MYTFFSRSAVLVQWGEIDLLKFDCFFFLFFFTFFYFFSSLFFVFLSFYFPLSVSLFSKVGLLWAEKILFFSFPFLSFSLLLFCLILHYSASYPHFKISSYLKRLFSGQGTIILYHNPPLTSPKHFPNDCLSSCMQGYPIYRAF